ncbi:hypothetical protein IGI04_027010 [Brassica rapa subsp. trilocularis]|uniref:Uncharacterized protein n=3 Tax=Brassica campestris TaxID=3711 RepID=M4D6R5_BRACM|nr:hypothetical protein IGI04_027010 [Brassica rapa subsp. trilocularis]
MTRSLEELNANFNKLIRLPDSIGFELTNLTKLDISTQTSSLASQSPLLTEKKSWGFGKLVKYGTFNGGSRSWNREEREGFIMPEYRSIHSLASPRVFRDVHPSPSLFSKDLF